MELLGETRSTSYYTFENVDITKYKAFAFSCGTTDYNRFLATTIIPANMVQYDQIKNRTHEVAYGVEPSVYRAIMYFISDTSFAMKTYNASYCVARLYGII